MSLQGQMPGTVRSRKADWVRGRAPASLHGELKRGIALRKKQPNEKERHGTKEALQNDGYRKAVRTLCEVDFT